MAPPEMAELPEKVTSPLLFVIKVVSPVITPEAAELSEKVISPRFPVKVVMPQEEQMAVPVLPEKMISL